MRSISIKDLYQGVGSLPYSIKELRHFVNVSSDSSRILLQTIVKCVLLLRFSVVEYANECYSLGGFPAD